MIQAILVDLASYSQCQSGNHRLVNLTGEVQIRKLSKTLDELFIFHRLSRP